MSSHNHHNICNPEVGKPQALYQTGGTHQTDGPVESTPLAEIGMGNYGKLMTKTGPRLYLVQL